MKKQAAPAPTGPDAGPWIDLGNGRSRSASTKKLRYDPSADPEYQQAIKRIQAQEQAAAAKVRAEENKKALDIIGKMMPLTVMKNAQPFKPEQADGTWSPPRAVYQVINVRPPSPEDVKHIKQFFANVARAGGRSA